MGRFMEMLSRLWGKGRFLCVGLDSAYDKIPTCCRETTVGSLSALFRFNRAIIGTTHNLVCAYKLNLGFYIACGAQGIAALIDTTRMIHEIAPGVPVILDGKFGDIGNTSEAYAKFAFDVCGADAVTVNPYLGAEALKPFLEREDRGIIVLARTSNPGAGEFQDLVLPPDREQLTRVTHLYQHVAKQVAEEWNECGNCAVVAGATSPGELAQIRKIVGDIPILIPGIGEQGGNLSASVRAGLNSQYEGIIVNASRSIIFASDGEDFADAAYAEAARLHEAILVCREEAMAL